MRLIDADELIERTWRWAVNSREAVQQMIKGCSTIDATPVVRCCNCKYLQWNMRQDGSLPLGVDEYECRHWCGGCDPTDFCSYGERRDEDEAD